MYRPLAPRQLAADLGLAAAAVLVLLSIGADQGSGRLIVVAGMCTALAVRRLSPGLALATAWATAVVQMALGIEPDPADLVVPAVLFASAAYGSRPVRWLGLASAPVGALAAAVHLVVLPRAAEMVRGGPGALLTEASVVVPAAQVFVAGAALFTLSWTLGLLVRVWMRGVESRRAQVEAERLMVVEQERNRIARDMHDVVAHSLAVVIAQADGARYARRSDPDAVDAALTAIGSTAREALADVRVLLARLRHSEGESPQPALADLERLVEQLRASGLGVAWSESGQRRPMSAAGQLAVYRVIQEALTNALRHGAPGGGAEVDLSWTETHLLVTVRNPRRGDEAAGAGGRPGAPGHGVTGMTERAALVGGWLTAEAAGDGFAVRAGIPLSAAAVAS